jgi:hypothetical protein
MLLQDIAYRVRATDRPAERSFIQWNEHEKQRSVFLRRIGVS